MIRFQHLALSVGCLLILTQPVDAQFAPPFFPGVMPFAQRGIDKPITAREPWSAAEHTAAVDSAIAATAALPEITRLPSRLQLAALLDQTGDRPDEARLLRQAAADLHRLGGPLHDLAQRLVEVGEVETARTLAAATAAANERQQVLSGMLDGAMKSGNLDLASEVLRVARHLPRLAAFDPFAAQAKALAAALAKAGRYRQAVAAFPVESPVFGAIDLPTLASQACAADPLLTGEAGHLLAVAALKLASAKGAARAPVEEIRALKACQGEAVARKLVAAMPPDVAEKLVAAPPTNDEIYQLAANAAKASGDGDEPTADRLFAAATAKLDVAFANRDTSADARRRFDTSANQVAVFLMKRNRLPVALSLVAKLPALEGLPILFNLADTIAVSHGDPRPVLDAIDNTFSGEPALVEVEAVEIRALRGVLPLGSPVYPLVETWLNKLPPEPSEPAMRPTRGIILGKPSDEPLQPILAAAEKAAPSIATIRRVLAQAKQGEVTQAIAEARMLTLTPRETGFLDMARAFVQALPADVLTPYATILGVDGQAVRAGMATSAADGLLIATERTVLAADNVAGAREVFAAVPTASSLKAAAAATLALGEARAGLPHNAMADLQTVDEPFARFAILRVIAAVRPSEPKGSP